MYFLHRLNIIAAIGYTCLAYRAGLQHRHASMAVMIVCASLYSYLVLVHRERVNRPRKR